MEKQYETQFSLSFRRDGAIRRFLSVYIDGRAWRNVTFLLLSFPLGIAYFVALVTGFSVGAGLAVTLIGLPILLVVFYLAGFATQFEAWFANRMIGAEVHPTAYTTSADTFLGQIGQALQDGRRWRGIAYLLMRFPMGIVGFVVTMVCVVTPLAMISAPLTYSAGTIEVFDWTINTLPEAVIASGLGLFGGALGLHALAFFVGVWRGIAEALLDTPSTKLKNDEKPKRVLAD